MGPASSSAAGASASSGVGGSWRGPLRRLVDDDSGAGPQRNRPHTAIGAIRRRPAEPGCPDGSGRTHRRRFARRWRPARALPTNTRLRQGISGSQPTWRAHPTRRSCARRPWVCGPYVPANTVHVGWGSNCRLIWAVVDSVWVRRQQTDGHVRCSWVASGCRA